MAAPFVTLGTTLTRAGNSIAKLIKIGKVELARETTDVTTLGSTSFFEEVLPALIRTPVIPIEGYFDVGDTNGQQGLQSDLTAGTLQAFVITFPAATGTTWTFSAYVTSFSTGDADLQGALPFTAALKITGVPSLGITLSAGLTTPWFSINNSAVIIPAAQAGVYSYIATVLTGITSVIVTPTAAAGVITITSGGTSQVVTSGQPSTAIALGAAGSLTDITISVQETNKAARVTLVRVARA